MLWALMTALAFCRSLAFGGTAGNITSLYSSDLNYPSGVAIDSSGNIYIADRSNNRVLKADRDTGILTTIAGNETAGYNGDNIAATSAELNAPFAVAVDSSGNVFIADTNNNRIRKIDHDTGIITTYAGNGTASYSGDDGLATSASLDQPYGIAIDSSGSLYVTDVNNNRVRKIDHDTGIITRYAGNVYNSIVSGDNASAVNASLYQPYGLTVDSSNNIYIADTENFAIRKVNHSDEKITTIAGVWGVDGYFGDGDLATSAHIYEPKGVAIDSSGNIYISDTGNNMIREVPHDTGIISSIAGINGYFGGNGDDIPAISAMLTYPLGMAIDSDGNLFFADEWNFAIREIYQAGPDVGSPSVSIGYGASYSDRSGSHSNLNGHSYIRIRCRDFGVGLNSSAITLSASSNVTFADTEESINSILTHGVSDGSDNPVFFYIVKTNAGTSSFTFSASDKASNKGQLPNTNVTTLSFVKGSSVQESDYRSVPKDQGKISILASDGDLRDVTITANDESISLGNVQAGTVKVIDLRSRLREDGNNSITVNATGDAGTVAQTLASSATLDYIDSAKEASRKVFARGDMNQDGRVTVADAIELLRIEAGLIRATPEERMLGDLDLDGGLTVNDAILALRMAIGR